MGSRPFAVRIFGSVPSSTSLRVRLSSMSGATRKSTVWTIWINRKKRVDGRTFEKIS